MKAFLSRCLTLIFLLGISNGFAGAQSKSTSKTDELSQKLDLKPSNNKIEHVFHITMSKKDFRKLSSVDSIQKDYLSDYTMTYNGDTLDVNEIELRGRSSMNFQRKSFSVKLNNKVSFSTNEETHKLKKFNLICLSMDQNYYRNKVAFDLMNHIGLFNLFYSYAEVIVNEKSQGVYLILQKPKNYAFKKEDAKVMLRRDYQHVIKKSYFKGEDTLMKVKCEQVFISIYNELLKKQGKDFYDELSEVLDVEQYFTWMAFNYLIGNRDYTDEVFFYNKASGDSIKFGIIPWDYDDVFFDHPHEGAFIRHINFGDKLAFSSEDQLDYKLISEYYTYAKYLENFEMMLEKLSISLIKETFELTYQELYPFYSRKDILAMSRVDKYGKTNLKKLESDMQQCYDKIVNKRERTARKIMPANKEKEASN